MSAGKEMAIPAAMVYKSVRINVLLSVAYVTVIMCLIVTVWFLKDGNEYAQGIVTLVLGRFLGYTDQVYGFEFGSTRDNKVKDEAIANMAATAMPSPNGKPIKADDVQIEAKGDVSIAKKAKRK